LFAVRVSFALASLACREAILNIIPAAINFDRSFNVGIPLSPAVLAGKFFTPKPPVCNQITESLVGSSDADRSNA
jgi:hypothetical protein